MSAIFLSSCALTSQTIQPFQSNQSVTWEEAIASYDSLAATSSSAFLMEMGKSDVGKPIHLFVLNKGAQDPFEISSERSVLLINNGIHPGEPCGVDASIQLAERLLASNSELLDSVVIGIIPIYNVGGALMRNSCVRANQNGPEEYGFRGNARNLDLNRDFIKSDSRNAHTFYSIFHALSPHVFIDTHTSNGADYQYVMTMINTQSDKAGELMGNYIKDEMSPALFESMEERGFGMTPYVYSLGKTPDDGIKDFLETPRYSTGYAALFNTIGFTSETHMLKPFAQRVESTYQFILACAEYMYAHNEVLIDLKSQADQAVTTQTEFELSWELDTTSFRTIPFKGFKAEYIESEVTGGERLRYNRSKPQTISIPYYDTYTATNVVEVPRSYIVPQAWGGVIQRLHENHVEMTPLPRDTIMVVEAYYIRDYSSSSRVYEGHHMNEVKKIDKVSEEVRCYEGDMVIKVDQTVNRYIVETLEPLSADAFFVWNFFDSAMQQKEWYSDYVFEDTAAELLKTDLDLKERFEAAKNEDPEMASSPSRQLYWIYINSPYFEGTVNRYPVYRWEGQLSK
ncbi:MAG: hypothetical protein MK081_04270 [Flavobacteriales bacterium]|nr:hypothetical protein [Flavobacteriales bacterium]